MEQTAVLTIVVYRDKHRKRVHLNAYEHGGCENDSNEDQANLEAHQGGNCPEEPETRATATLRLSERAETHVLHK